MKTAQIKERNGSMVGESINRSRSEEVMVFCPNCKALQTVWLDGDTLMPTVKFLQLGKHIYHNCGATQPCRLFFDR